jgi:hypothetical protein
MNDAALATLRLQIRHMLSDLIGATGVGEETTELRRQVLATFAFGMVMAAGMHDNLEPEQVHALALGALVDSFGYSADQAATFAEALIEAISGDERPTSNAIIHRGIEGYGQWRANDVEALKGNVGVIFAVLEEPQEDAPDGEGT